MSQHVDKPNHTARWERGGVDRVPPIIEAWSRKAFVWTALLGAAVVVGAGYAWWPLWFLAVPWVAFVIVGVGDMRQTRHTLMRNFPVLAHFRYVAESVRPELRQYFVESDHEENPFSRERRTIIYQRAKDQVDSLPFGTRRDVYGDGYEWIAHSLAPTHPEQASARVAVGGPACTKPYSASIFNVSAMSFGSLSKNAVLALNSGAAAGQFSHNTGEGGISPYHLEPGGDLTWQIGTGYFGCRTPEGGFSPEKFAETSSLDAVKMIEIKLSQGAKPAHGGILPGEKVTPEIAAIRGVEVGKTVLSPPCHTAFDGPRGLLEFVAQLRELSGGKPVGFKLCVGQPAEFLAICKAMLETGITPDFITVDGAEGGTGAAPLEFSNSVGMPLHDGLSFVHNALRAIGKRDDIKLISAGKISSGFHVLRQLALGADLCNSARGMMFALGCIQALKCNTNHCPAGVATQDPKLMKGLHVPTKAGRVANFHRKTVDSVLELVGAAGLDSPEELRPWHIYRRLSGSEVCHLGEIYPPFDENCLVEGTAPDTLQTLWERASAERF